jgi:hypothetical protein
MWSIPRPNGIGDVWLQRLSISWVNDTNHYIGINMQLDLRGVGALNNNSLQFFRSLMLKIRKYGKVLIKHGSFIQDGRSSFLGIAYIPRNPPYVQ